MSGAELFMVTVVVPDMEQDVAHFTNDWGFALAKDEHHVSGHRWVEIDPGGGARLRLVEASTEEHRSVIGHQAGGRVAFFLRLDDFDAALARLEANGVEVVEPTRTESYGRIVVLKDNFGNRWDVLDAEFAVAA